jgi:hypothetical protein
MKGLALLPLVALLGAGCVVHTLPPPEPAEPPPPPPEQAPVAAPESVFYYGEHALPGGGWCYLEGPHEHDFYPQHPDYYVNDGGYYYWRGPLVISYYAGHPLPGGGWCTISGPHVHNYYPPREYHVHWAFTPGRGYVYRGPYTAVRPPPRTYWVRPAPAPRYAPAPGPKARPYAPGHGNVPPGHGGVPPGQAKKGDKDKHDKDTAERSHGPKPATARDDSKRRT